MIIIHILLEHADKEIKSIIRKNRRIKKHHEGKVLSIERRSLLGGKSYTVCMIEGKEDSIGIGWLKVV